MIRKEEVYEIGRIGKPHGIHGELQMQISDDIFDEVEANYLILEIEGILVPFFLEEYRFRSDELVLVKFVDIDTEIRARELTGSKVYFPRKLADEQTTQPSLAQLVGYSVINDDDSETIGKIISIDTTTINTLFEVERTDGSIVLLPASISLMVHIDSKTQIIRMKIPFGLLEL